MKITAEQIPPEARDAVVRLQVEQPDATPAELIAAVLTAWPGADTGPNIYHQRDAILHLPLPQKEVE